MPDLGNFAAVSELPAAVLRVVGQPDEACMLPLVLQSPFGFYVSGVRVCPITQEVHAEDVIVDDRPRRSHCSGYPLNEVSEGFLCIRCLQCAAGVVADVHCRTIGPNS